MDLTVTDAASGSATGGVAQIEPDQSASTIAEPRDLRRKSSAHEVDQISDGDCEMQLPLFALLRDFFFFFPRLSLGEGDEIMVWRKEGRPKKREWTGTHGAGSCREAVEFRVSITIEASGAGVEEGEVKVCASQVEELPIENKG